MVLLYHRDSNADFTALTGSGASATVYFVGTANETQIVRVAINDDGIVEADETFSLAITTITNATVDLSNFDIDDTAIATITNNDTIAITISKTIALESSNQTVTVTLDNPVQGGVTVVLDSCFTCTEVTLETTDFTSIANTLFIADGNTTATTTITIIDDTIVEADESITIVLTNLVAPATILESNFITPTFIAGSLINASLAGSFEVVNNDTTSFTISSINTLEDSNQTVTITLDNAVADGFTLFLESGFGSAIEDTDYASIDSNQLFFSGAANETETFQLLVINDATVEDR